MREKLKVCLQHAATLEKSAVLKLSGATEGFKSAVELMIEAVETIERLQARIVELERVCDAFADIFAQSAEAENPNVGGVVLP